VGKGRKEDDLRKLAARLGVRTRFAVDVPWSELPGLYRQMDVFAMPCKSRWGGLEVEGLGLVFLEAAATGLPVLAGDSGGSPETVIAGETGFVVHDVADIVEGLGMVLGDPEWARRMGAAGRALVERNFTWGRVVERVQTGFAEVL
jgi:phosphatidylinositol alpha-1,6-mannosyltransferase